MIDIIIPVYNCIKYTRMCLHSIWENTDIEHNILIVDNGSQIPYMTIDLKGLEIIRFEQNEGFAKAVNIGIKQSESEYVCILNNDTLVTPSWLENLINWLDSVDIVAPLTNYAYNSQHYSGDIYQNEDELMEFALSIQNRKSIFLTDSVIGMCMVFKRKLIDKIGNFDERFWNGFEDIEFCKRARKAGYKIGIAQNVFVHHYGSATFKENNIDYLKNHEFNKRLFKLKYAN